MNLEYQLSLAAVGRLLHQTDLDEFNIKANDLREGRIDHLIVLVPQQPDLDETFNTTETPWVGAIQYA